MDYKIIHNQRLAGFLMSCGCKLIEVRKNLKDKSLLVYIFRNTKFLNDRMSEYLKEKTA